MAFSAYSLSHDVVKGTKGVHANGYALNTDGGIVGPDYEDPSNPVLGTKCAIVSQASTAIATLTFSSSGTTVTASADASGDISVGDVIFEASNLEYREVVSITSTTVFEVDSAFTTDLSSDSLSKKDVVYHTSRVSNLASFQGLVYFEDSVNEDIPVSDEAIIQSLED